MSFLENRQRVSNGQVIGLLEIYSVAFPEVLRIADDNRAAPIISNGNEFACFPFAFVLPKDQSRQAAQMRLEISNVGRSIIEDLESWVPGYPIYAKLMLVDKTDLDAVYKQWHLPLSNVSCTMQTVTATCGNHLFLQQKCVRLRYDRFYSPGNY